MVGSAYPFPEKPRLREKRMALSDGHLFNERLTTTTYTSIKAKGAPDGRYIAVIPDTLRQQEFEAPAQLTINVFIQPPWYQPTFTIQIDDVTYATELRSGLRTGPRLAP